MCVFLCVLTHLIRISKEYVVLKYQQACENINKHVKPLSLSLPNLTSLRILALRLCGWLWYCIEDAFLKSGLLEILYITQPVRFIFWNCWSTSFLLDSVMNSDVFFLPWVLAKNSITWGTGFGLNLVPRLISSDLSCQIPHRLFWSQRSLIIMNFSPYTCFSAIFCDKAPTTFCYRSYFLFIAI